MEKEQRTKPKSQKRDSLKLLRMDIIAPLYKRGYSFRELRLEVMARLNLAAYSLRTVKNDVDSLLAEWRETRIENTDLAVQLELERIDTLVKEAWAAWEKSKESYDKKKQRQEGVPVPKDDDSGQVVQTANGLLVVKVSQDKEEVRSCGDPRYIDTINKLLIERRKLLGLYSPEKQIVATDLSFANFLMKTGTKKKTE